MSHTEKKLDQYYEMANAPISHIIPKLAAPTIVSMLISSIYNMADTFFVSQLGTSASGAVGVIFSAMSIIQALAFMIGMGSGNYMTRSLGAGKRELAEQIVSIAFFTGIIMGLVITVSATFNIHRVVLLLGATETIAPYAEAYAHYIFIAAPFMICSFIMNNLLRFQGKASFAMVDRRRHESFHQRPGLFYGRNALRSHWSRGKSPAGSAVYLYPWNGYCRSCFSYRTFPVYQLLHPFMDVQSSGKLYFYQHTQIPPETGDLSRGPLWRHPIFRTSGNCQCGYDPDELYVSALW